MFRKLALSIVLVAMLASPASAHRHYCVSGFGPTITIGYLVPTPRGWRLQVVRFPAYIRIHK
jgi:hypothetical protein